MKNSLGLAFSDAKDFLSNEVNRVLVVTVIIGSFMCYGQYRTEYLLNKIDTQNIEGKQEMIAEIKKNRDKIHFRYFNLTRSMEEIFNVKLDTGNGKIEK